MEAEQVMHYNEQFYNNVWKNSRISSHRVWPIWKTIEQHIEPDCKLLELGPGMRPRIPVKDSYFIEISNKAVELLNSNGGNAVLPHKNSFLKKKGVFDVVCAFEVLEHIPDDETVLKQLSHAMNKDGMLFISVPLHMEYWTELDSVVGHYRRYDPAALESLLERNGFAIEGYAEDTIFSKVYTHKTLQKIAKYFMKKYTKLAMKLEFYCLRLLCAYARKFKPIMWKHDSLATVNERASGVYVMCRKGN